MAYYLITSRSGAGKTTICQELLHRGYPAVDGDRAPGLAGWFERVSEQPVTMDYSQPVIDPDVYAWNWDAAVLAGILANRETLYVCGSADNSVDFFDRFDKVFVLTLEPATQRQRLAARSEHDYGKSPAMQDIIIGEQRAFVVEALAHGAIAVDAMPPVTQIVDRILELASL